MSNPSPYHSTVCTCLDSAQRFMCPVHGNTASQPACGHEQQLAERGRRIAELEAQVAEMAQKRDELRKWRDHHKERAAEAEARVKELTKQLAEAESFKLNMQHARKVELEDYHEMQAHLSALLLAGEPFLKFLAAFDAMPIRSLDPVEIYSIHGGEHVKPHGASLRWPDLRALAAALEKAREAKP